MNAWRSGWRLVLLLVGFGLLVLLVMDFNARVAELRLLTGEHERVSARVTSLYSTQISYETAVANVSSEEEVLLWAYTFGHYAYDGDTIIVPVQKPGSVPTPVPTPTPTPQVIENWQIWLSLFVDQP